MLLRVNCQRYAYKLRLSNLAPLILIHRQEKPVGKGEGQLVPWNRLTGPHLLPCHYQDICQSLILLPFTSLTQKQELAMKSSKGSHGGSLASLGGLLRLSAITEKQECGQDCRLSNTQLNWYFR